MIPLIPPVEGFNDFIGAWLYQGEVTILVDVGPASTARMLLDALEDRHIDTLDFILLTHIHLDHAGGISRIWHQFPESRVVCHPSALAHLIDPKRLWKGSVKTLGAIAAAYGPPEPIPSDALTSCEDLHSSVVDSILTPGHAEHHVSYRIEDTLFVGEACGVVLQTGKNHAYMRPATPPRLFLNLFLKSLDELMGKGELQICCGHYGRYENGSALLAAHRDQLLRWELIIEQILNKEQSDDLIRKCLDKLVASDHLLKGFREMESRIQKRELFFLENSIRGFIGYIQGKKGGN
ncbi:MAG: MBL fold metallo-hydrolase [Thermodesulfobacteriota bacterium]